MLTVGQLRKAIQYLDDEYEVYTFDRLYGYPEPAHTITVSHEASFCDSISYQKQSVVVR